MIRNSLSNDKLKITGLPGFVEEGQLGAVEAEEQEKVLAGEYPVGLHACGRIWSKVDVHTAIIVQLHIGQVV